MVFRYKPHYFNNESKLSAYTEYKIIFGNFILALIKRFWSTTQDWIL